MQTFLPYADFQQSASVLDRARLGKQRVETLQVLHALTRGTGWIHHPITKMWRGYEPALVEYGIVICAEWVSRGYADTVADSLNGIFEELANTTIVYPKWLGDEELHQSHRANLLRKDPIWYGQFGWTEPRDMPYKWVVTE